MEQRFVAEMCSKRAFGCLSDTEVRRCLEAALAPLPVPTYPGRTAEEEAELRKHPEYEPGAPTYVEWLRDQLRAAEAKLAKVRAWLSDGRLSKLKAILDEEP